MFIVFLVLHHHQPGGYLSSPTPNPAAMPEKKLEHHHTHTK
jgi:hypothetical protein